MKKKSKYLKGGLSQMGYRDDSPYRGRDSITINSNVIDMDSTGIPLYAEDETGYSKVLNPYSGQHIFPGKNVRETPINPYQRGGITPKEIYEYLFDDDKDKEDLPASAPSEDEVRRIESPQPQQEDDYQSILDMAMQVGQYDDDPFSNQRKYQTSPYGVQEAGFQSFNSPQEGRQALEHQLELYKTGKTRNNVNPYSSIFDAMSVYAPAEDNNDPVQYANFVANKLGVPVTTPISRISTKKWADAITIMEGNKYGNNPGNLKFAR